MDDDLQPDELRLEGPVERIAGQLVVSVPLGEGGSQFIHCTRRIARIDLQRDCLDIFIPTSLATKIGIDDGSRVVISNQGGTFHCWRA